MPHTAFDPALGFSDAAPNASRQTSRKVSARGPNMGWLRFSRAVRRQLPVALGVVFLAVPAAALHSFLTPLEPWAPIAVSWLGAMILLALVAAFIRESARDAIGVNDFGAKRAYALLGAAPELTAADLRQLPPDQRSPLGLLAFQPASAFATAFRNLQSVLPERGVVAFIGPAAGEGASTAALCAAVSATQQDKKVLLIDCDLRQRALTKAIGGDPGEGILEACEAPEYWRNYISEEEETGLHFIPAARPRTAWRGLAGQRGFDALLTRARNEYDLVVLDCPPSSTADGPMIARLADKNVVIAGWDHTPRAAVRETMRTLRARRGGAGVYINRVPSGFRFGRLRAD